MRKALRVFFWMIKGVLLLIALAALVMWPVSCGRLMSLSATKFTTWLHYQEFRSYRVGGWDGHLTVGRASRHSTDESNINWFVAQVQGFGERWRFRATSGKLAPNLGPVYYRRGPIRYHSYRHGVAADLQVGAEVAIPCWLVALAAGAWPFTSIAFTFHRRIQLRRAAREGLCTSCGYDLRASPERCPECGTQNDHPTSIIQT
jgi:hypothetical protein